MPKKTKYGQILQFATEDTQKATFKGTIYRKQIAKFGQWVNPDYPWFSDDPNMTLDEAWGETIVKNFNDDALGSPVPVPLITNATPSSATDTGIKGQVAWDSSYIYVCVATDVWKRTALSSW